MRTERIGILGGTFHPIHNGHIQLAEHAKDVLSFDRVLFVIDRVPPHKELSNGAATDDRLKMLQLALADHPEMEIETMELFREGKSYSFDTLTALRERHPNAELFFLMGSDMLRSFATWYRPEGISKLCTLVCTERLGQSGGEVEVMQTLREQFGTRTILLDSVSDLSSTYVRECIANARPIDDLVPSAVADEIYLKGLYQPADNAARYKKLRDALPEKRMRHTAGVVRTAIRLADQYHVDPQKAQIAALLHDCAKYLSDEELLTRSKDPVKILPVLHSEVGAMIAQEEYGISDPDILRAIRLHTTGDADMTTLDKIIYLADMIEPGRSYPGVEELRQEKDLNTCLIKALQHSIKHVMSMGLEIHPATYRAIQDLGGTI